MGALGVLATGCKIVINGAETYETCMVTSDCSSSADNCLSVSTGGSSRAICTRGCTGHFDCPGSGRCVAVAGGGATCFEGCLSSTTCEPGWSCQRTGGEDICLPGTAGGTVPTYGTCSVSADCSMATDTCLEIQGPDTTRISMCSHSCVTQGDCPGGYCLSFDRGASFQCFDRCMRSSDCESGWSCLDNAGGYVPPICLPGGGQAPGIPPYFECTIGSTTECSSALTGCFDINVDGARTGMCSNSCSSAADCPADEMFAAATCMSFDGGVTSTCFHSCATAADCPTGFVCKSSIAGGPSFPPICLPN
jgi:hypothetical protein